MKRQARKRDNQGKRDGASVANAEAEAEAEAGAFAQAMADVVRLPPDPRGRFRPAPPVSAFRARTPASSPPASCEDDSSGSSFVAPGVDRRELRKLTRGEHTPGSRLDLHGQTATAAIAAVKQFIDHGRHRHRCVCIVHGRGLHSEGNIPVLKTRVRECLRHHPAVLAFADAPRADGGAGAVYVLLRR